MADEVEEAPEEARRKVTIPILVEMDGYAVKIGEMNLRDDQYGRVHFRGMNLHTLTLEGVMFELKVVPTIVFHTG